MTIIRFKIGDAFPASDPVARFLTGLAMISNDWLRSIEEMLKLGDAPEEVGRRISLFRRQAALVHEAATFISDARRMFSQVASFIDGLEAETREGVERVTGTVDNRSRHYLGEWLEDHRNVTHHYPKMHPEAAKHGQDEMANALGQAADIESTIDSGRYFGEARFRYADGRRAAAATARRPQLDGRSTRHSDGRFRPARGTGLLANPPGRDIHRRTGHDGSA